MTFALLGLDVTSGAPALLALVHHDPTGTESTRFAVGAVLPIAAWRTPDFEDAMRMYRRLLRADERYFPAFNPLVVTIGLDGKLAAILVPEGANVDGVPELRAVSRRYGVPIQHR